MHWVVSNEWPKEKMSRITCNHNPLRLKLTNYIVANRPICLRVRVLWCWLSCLCCGQVAIAVLRLGSCSIASRAIGSSRCRARALVCCLCVIIVAIIGRCSLLLGLVLLVLIWNHIDGRGCLRACLRAVRIIRRRWLLVLLVLVLDCAHTRVRANCSLLI